MTARKHLEELTASLGRIRLAARARPPELQIREVLDVRLAGVDDLLRRQAERNVAREWKILAARFIRNREERIARRVVVDLDQIDASPLERLNRSPTFVRRAHAHS